MYMITKYKIFEHVKNKALTESTLDHVIKRLQKLFIKMGYDVEIDNEISGSDYFRKNIEIYTKNRLDMNDKHIEKIRKILDKYLVSYIHNILLTTNMILSYSSIEQSEYYDANRFLKGLVIKLYLKDLKIKRVKPDRYVYHVSPIKNRKSIKKDGLLLKSAKESEEWKYETYLYYPPAVFAKDKFDTGLGELWHDTDLRSRDVWRIDTLNLPNIWWVDANLYFSDKYPTDAVMTFEPIPPKALKRIVKHKKLPPEYEATNKEYAKFVL